MIAVGGGSYGNGADGHMHEPSRGPNTGDVSTTCRICGVPLTRVTIDVNRGYGGIAASVDGIISKEAEGGMAVPDIEPFKNRKARRAEKAKARHGSR